MPGAPLTVCLSAGARGRSGNARRPDGCSRGGRNLWYVQTMGANRARNPSDMVPLIFTLVNFDVFEVLRHYANVLKGARKPSDLVPLSSLRQYTKSLYKVMYEVI